jgi:hypothetical protein
MASVIVNNPAVANGELVFRGTRVPFKALVRSPLEHSSAGILLACEIVEHTGLWLKNRCREVSRTTSRRLAKTVCPIRLQTHRPSPGGVGLSLGGYVGARPFPLCGHALARIVPPFTSRI